MLTMVRVVNEAGAILELPLGDISSGFSVQGIDGLDPVAATLVSSSYATQDGEQYHASRREKRNIVLKLGLEPDYSTSSARQLRDRLYGFLMPKKPCTLIFVSDDDADVWIAGRVETFDAPLFTASPLVTISIINFDPDFQSMDSVQLELTATSGLDEVVIDYDGTVEAGVAFRLNITQNLTELSIANRPENSNTQTMDFSANFLAGDVLDVSTIPGSKSVTLIRNTDSSSLLYALSPYSPWISLIPGRNNLRVSPAEAGGPYLMSYTNRYGGL